MENTTKDMADLRVLLVDDEPFILKLGSTLLAKAGIGEVRTAEGGEQALALVREQPDAFDVVLTDINMPGTDGIAVLSGLADIGFRGGVGLLSGEDRRVLESVHELGAARALNVLGVLQKPLQVEAVIKLLNGFEPRSAGPEVQAGAGGQSSTEDDGEIDGDELALALRNGEIEPYFQPIVSREAARCTAPRRSRAGYIRAGAW